MKAVLAALWILSLVGAFGLARLSAPDRDGIDLGSLESFRAGLEERDALERAYRLGAFLRELGPDGFPAALDAVEGHQHGMKPHDVRLFMHAWTRFDAPGALEWANDWPTRWRDTLMTEAIYAWGFRDGPAALGAYEELKDPPKSLLTSLREGWVHSDDRERVTEYVASVDDPRTRRRLTFLLTSEVMADGPDALMDWVEALSDDTPNDFKQGAFYHAAGHLARRDPRRAATWFEEQRTQWYSQGGLDLIARHWAWHHDPAALFDWLRGLPEGGRAGETSDAIAVGFRVWLQDDPAAGEAWLQSALPDPALDPAVAELVKVLLPRSQDEAAAWAQRIEDEKLRTSTRKLVELRRRATEPEAASSGRGRSDLPEPQSILNGGQQLAAPGAAEAAAEPGDR